MPTKPAARPLVLIVSEQARELRDKLQTHRPGAEVLAALSGDKGLRLLSARPVEVVLLHLHSDWEPDLELLRGLRSYHPGLPVVIMAECATVAGAEACARLCTQGYVRMPCSPGELWRALDAALAAFPGQGLPEPGAAPPAPPAPPVARRKEVAQAVGFIHAHHQTGITPRQVAHQVHLSRNHLGGLFKAETGHTLSEYINLCRVASAMRIIAQQPDLGFSLVAERVGFRSESYFSKVFKRLVGMPPKSYRQKAMSQGRAAVAWREGMIRVLFRG